MCACQLTELRTRKRRKSYVAKPRRKARPFEAIHSDPGRERLRWSRQPNRESLQLSVKPFLKPRFALFSKI